MTDTELIPQTLPVTFEVDPHHEVVYFTLRGDLTFAALCEANEELQCDPRFRPGMAYLVDCRVLTAIPSAGEIRKLAIDRCFRGATSPLERVAIVALTRLGVEYAMAWELFADSPKEDVRMFMTHADARKWLGLPVNM